MTMPAGKYYIGDLCYVLHDSWYEFCDITISDHKCLEGEFNFKDGRRFASFSTKWGDGQYEDQYARTYAVDAGLIGCISVRDIDQGLIEMTTGVGPRFGGQIHIFDKDFNCYEEDGKIHIGDVVVDTDPTFEEDYDYDEEENY